MANFTFLEGKSEFSSFANACIHAEEIYKDSPNSSVTTSRQALENIVEYIYANNGNLRNVNISGQKLFDLMEYPAFKNMIPHKLFNKMHTIRQLANDILHNNRQISEKQAVLCLRALFEIVQWVDKKYGRDYFPRQFDEDDVPENDSLLKKAGKYAAAAAVGGVILTGLKSVFLDDRRY